MWKIFIHFYILKYNYSFFLVVSWPLEKRIILLPIVGVTSVIVLCVIIVMYLWRRKMTKRNGKHFVKCIPCRTHIYIYIYIWRQKHHSRKKNILIPSIIRHSRTSQIIQQIRNSRWNIRWNANKMFENGIDQGIHTIRNSATNTFIKNRKTFIILFNRMFNRISGFFCEIWISPSTKSTRKTSNK